MQDINKLEELQLDNEFTLAPDFSATKVGGGEIKLSDYRHKKNILLVFNRGFF